MMGTDVLEDALVIRPDALDELEIIGDAVRRGNAWGPVVGNRKGLRRGRCDFGSQAVGLSVGFGRKAIRFGPGGSFSGEAIRLGLFRRFGSATVGLGLCGSLCS